MQLRNWFEELLKDIYQVVSTLFKIMIPALLLVKILEEIGGVEVIAWLLGPVMAWVGLPESMGLVWATTLLTNIYTGMIIFFNVAQTESLNVAQVTVIGTMMLIAHTLPIEARIAQKAGVRLGVTLLIRLSSALLLGFILHHLYAWGGWLQQPSQLLWSPGVVDSSITAWLLSQLKSLGMIVLIISALLTTLKLLRLLHIERLLHWLLQPVLRMLGIGPTATTITIVGFTLGLAFGGGLLIKEAQAGHVPYRDVFSAMTLLALCHSVIEDTLLILLLGADISGILWMRLLFGFLVVAFVSRLLSRSSEQFHRRFLVHELEVAK
ncbi:MAG: hypothetical protein FHK82_17020 [Sedimenticola thiotaurini]|uniref:Nucleoside transporter/FeoB GTPase Gate domain-containing protein n=1 Tax=Sedimenticola thiotaurini TaxID=1543721 RepID=A0A558CLK0_9GAMM|nr:hypothetical protein [Sedimenticola sp.]TVT49657.1 MAG: hypothetical protein FHK82_17020 [Sedimenticola thiotaurini]